MTRQRGATAPTDRQRKVAAVRSIVAVFREFEQVARQQEMSLAHYRLLLFLRNGPQRAGEIAASSLVAKPTVSLQFADLRDRGWVAALIDPRDKRASRLELTPQGRAAMDSFETRLVETLESATPPDSHEAVIDGLNRLYLALGETRERRLGQR
ncbi:MAG: MarR family winged helix-turn-helix transcriptional regulator [Burkholderiaceae bacterium]